MVDNYKEFWYIYIYILNVINIEIIKLMECIYIYFKCHQCRNYQINGDIYYFFKIDRDYQIIGDIYCFLG